MKNKLSVIVDYYLEITNQGPENYARHLRAAKELLEFCAGDTAEACILLDKTKKDVGDYCDDWKIETVLRRYPFLK